MKRALALLLLGGVSLAAGPAATTRPAPEENVDVAALVKQLASPVYVEREKAAGALSRAFADHAAEIEAASKRVDLDPQAVMVLQQIVAEQKPRALARARGERIARETIEKNQRSALESYEKVGRRNPKWDATAHEVIETFTGINERHPDYAQRTRKLGELGEEIKKLGCDDPLVRYFLLRARGFGGNADMSAVAREMKGVVDDLEASGYPAQRKCWAQARYTELILRYQLWQTLHDWKKELGRRLDLAVGHWAETVRDPSMDDAMASELAQVVWYGWAMVKGKGRNQYGDCAKLCQLLMPAWERAMPNTIGPLVFKGSVYAQYAWEVPGLNSGTMTDEARKEMHERLEVARAALEKAYAMDPADPRAAQEMMTIEMGEGGDDRRDQMEFWWKRAMEADPDNYAACTSKLYFLEPRWDGSAADMIRFGRECLRGGNWEGRIPFILVDAHWKLAQDAPDRDEYFAQPEVWDDLRSVYEPYLKRHPDAAWDRSYYAYYATLGGHWDVARQQFEILGDNPELKPFGTKAAYEYLRERAKNGGKP